MIKQLNRSKKDYLPSYAIIEDTFWHNIAQMTSTTNACIPCFVATIIKQCRIIEETGVNTMKTVARVNLENSWNWRKSYMKETLTQNNYTKRLSNQRNHRVHCSHISLTPIPHHHTHHQHYYTFHSLMGFKEKLRWEWWEIKGVTGDWHKFMRMQRENCKKVKN